MKTDTVIEIFCESINIDKHALFEGNMQCHHYYRAMVYLILREKSGLSSYQLAKMFNRDRRNVMRRISRIRFFINKYKDVRDEYLSILKKIEDASNDAPSESMEE